MPIFNAVYTVRMGCARRDRVDVAIVRRSAGRPHPLGVARRRGAADGTARQRLAGTFEKVDKRRLSRRNTRRNILRFPIWHVCQRCIISTPCCRSGGLAIYCMLCGPGKDGRASFTVTCDHRVVLGAGRRTVSSQTAGAIPERSLRSFLPREHSI